MQSMTEFLATAPQWVKVAFESCEKFAGIKWFRSSGDRDWEKDERRVYPDLAGAEAVSSNVVNWPMAEAGMPAGLPGTDQHYVMLDIDHEAVLIPSSTPGHSHLIINKALPWAQYETLLKALAEAGLIEWGFVDASVGRQASFLRLPWIGKGTEKQDALRAVEEWLDADLRPPELQGPEAVEAYLQG